MAYWESRCVTTYMALAVAGQIHPFLNSVVNAEHYSAESIEFWECSPAQTVRLRRSSARRCFRCSAEI